MFRQTLFLLCLLGALEFSTACNVQQPSPAPAPNMANPASVFCEQKGGKLEFAQDATGGTSGVCVFPDGSQCDEWAYFRGECKPGGSPTPARSAAAAPVETESVGWKTYRNPKLGYRFSYPADAAIGNADDPQRTLTITGPQVANEHWPMIYFSHPSDREDYRPPEGVDLVKWLTEHNLLSVSGKQGEVLQADVQIAGTRAVHTRFARSPQSYAYDKYHFAKGQQLYSVVIVHTGDKEDWGLYNRFLESIRFE